MKYTKIVLTVCSVSAAFFLSACGGGNSGGMSSDATGTFIDAPVENLKYSCNISGINGVTNSDGQFSCKYGDEVSFYMGAMTVGPVEFVEDMVITPYKLYPTNSSAAVRLAQLLQSLDDDGDISERITIVEKYAEAITEMLDPTESSFVNRAQALLDSVDVVLVDEKAAKVHLAAQDNSSPVVILKGEAQVTMKVGEEYMDAGATGYDEFDGKMDPVKSGSVDTSKSGTYMITYKATDQAGNTGSISRKVMVVEEMSADTTPPVVTLNGNASVMITVGNSYADAGATAIDNVDGALTPEKSGTADTSKAGTYTITWSATDAAGNRGSASRTVIVEESGAPTPTISEELEASEMGDSCIAENGESGEVAKSQDPFGNSIPGTATCEVIGGTEEPTPTISEELEASEMGDSCIAENGESGEVVKSQDPFGNPIPGTATCEVIGGTEEPTPTISEELEASEMGDSCIAENGESGEVVKSQDPFGNPIPGTATCEVAQ